MNVLRSVSDQCRLWAKESKESGWSTHQIEGNLRLAAELLVDANTLESFLERRIEGIKNDLIGKDVQLEEGKPLPRPTCPRCGGDVAGFYAFVYQLPAPEGGGTMLMQAWCCPHAGCRALLMVLPIGIQSGKVTAPGKPGWPGGPS